MVFILACLLGFTKSKLEFRKLFLIVALVTPENTFFVEIA